MSSEGYGPFSLTTAMPDSWATEPIIGVVPRHLRDAGMERLGEIERDAKLRQIASEVAARYGAVDEE